MSAKSKKSSKAIDRPINAETLRRANDTAQRYQIILTHEEGHWFGRGLELPQVFGDGKTANQCIENVREALAGAVAYLLEEGHRPPSPARAAALPAGCGPSTGRMRMPPPDLSTVTRLPMRRADPSAV